LDDKFYFLSIEASLGFYDKTYQLFLDLNLKKFCRMYCNLLNFFFLTKFNILTLKILKKKNLFLILKYFFLLKKNIKFLLTKKNWEIKPLFIILNKKTRSLKKKLKILNRLLKYEMPFTKPCHAIIYSEDRINEVFTKNKSNEQMELWNSLTLYNFGLTYGEDALVEYLSEEADIFDESNWGGILNVQEGALLKSEFTEIYDNNKK